MDTLADLLSVEKAFAAARLPWAVVKGHDVGGQPRDERGRWRAVTSALLAAHPHPGPGPVSPVGGARPDLLARDPALRAARAEYDAHTAAFQRHRVAALVRRMLAEPHRLVPAGDKNKRARAVRAVGDAGSALTDYETLTLPGFAAHHAAVAQSHPEGAAALAAARAEARRRHEAAVGHAGQLVEALDGADRERGRRALERVRPRPGPEASGASGAKALRLPWAIITKKRDAAGHEHAADGRFGAGGSRKVASGRHANPQAPPRTPPARSARPAPPKASTTGDSPEGVGASPDAKARTLLARLREVPAQLRTQVASFVRGKYRRLSKRYGPKGAAAILAASVALVPVPVPGTSLLPVALAEAFLAIRRAVTQKGHEPELSPEAVRREAHAFLRELYAHCGETWEPSE